MSNKLLSFIIYILWTVRCVQYIQEFIVTIIVVITIDIKKKTTIIDRHNMGGHSFLNYKLL